MTRNSCLLVSVSDFYWVSSRKTSDFFMIPTVARIQSHQNLRFIHRRINLPSYFASSPLICIKSFPFFYGCIPTSSVLSFLSFISFLYFNLTSFRLLVNSGTSLTLDIFVFRPASSLYVCILPELFVYTLTLPPISAFDAEFLSLSF